MIQIKHKITGAILLEVNARSLEGYTLGSANLRYANLSSANLRSANLSYADIDFSCWPLWCGSQSVKVDKKLAMQLAAHFCAVECEDEEYKAAKSAILEFAKGSHRSADLKI